MNTQNISKIRAHDAIVGLLYLSGVDYLTLQIIIIFYGLSSALEHYK